MQDLRNTKITSVEVAQMVGKDHSKLLRDIRKYSEQLGEAKIGLSDFFTKLAGSIIPNCPHNISNALAIS